MRGGLLLILIAFYIPATAQQKQAHAPTIQNQVFAITEVMYHDVVDPTAAARFYAYSMLTGYTILTKLDSSAKPLQSGFENFPLIPALNKSKVDKEIAVLYGILETGKMMIPSGYLLAEKQNDMARAFKERYRQDVVDSSIQFAVRISNIITRYASTDGYFKLSTYARYKPLQGDQYWRPTSPSYLPASEPNWNTIRSFFIDSASQFRPVDLIKYDKDSLSQFYKLAQEVYQTCTHLTAEQKFIANYWDCNPFAVQYQGHMSIGLKKISPGGHWMSIAGIACKEARLSFSKSMFVITMVALGLHDSFISCWDEKYRSNRVRPETVINSLIDEKWTPILQTPPFPEYSSGHSVISTVSAEILTRLLGDHFSFTDNTEEYLGMPVRKFNSFREAAAEARISRLYGGIHFSDAIVRGAEQGVKIADFIINKIDLQPLALNKKQNILP